MLVNLYGTDFDSLSLPYIQFKPGQLVCVTDVCVKFSKSPTTLYLLTSSLIDKSPANLKQELLFINQVYKNFFHITPTHKKYYKIQCLDFRASQFNLIEYETEKKVENIKNVYIQLEIIDGFQ